MLSRNSTLVFFIDGPGLGGSEINAIKIIEFFVKNSYYVEAVLHRSASDDLIEKIVNLKLTVQFFDYTNRTKDLIKSFLQYQKFFKTRKSSICIIWGHHLDSNRWLQLYCAFAGIRFFVVEQLLPTNYSILKRSKLTIPIKKLVVSRAQSVIICAYSQEKPYQKVFKTNNTFVISNARDILAINTTTHSLRSLNANEDEIKILSLARLTHQKDPITVIKAFNLIHGVHKVRLIWVGDGDLLDDCKRLVTNLGIEDRVTFVGFDKEPLKWLAMADLFILASLWEGLPGSLIEAMAARVPVIATDIPGNNELVKNEKTGMLIPVADQNALANAMIRLIENPKYRKFLAENAFDHVSENYSIEKEQEGWLRVMSKIKPSVNVKNFF